jgi:hypothetical protein
VIEDKNVRTRIAAQGHDVFLENFTEETIVSQYMAFFEERLSG